MPLPENPPTGRVIFEPPSTFPADFTHFWTLWREERFWACHEALEDVWRTEESPSRRRYIQGIIHLAVAVFQHRRGNPKGAARQMLRASIRLEPFLPEFENLNVAALIEAVKQEIDASLVMKHNGLDELETAIRAKLAA